MTFAEPMTASEAAVLDTFVVPRYLARFSELALGLMVSGPEARILHVGCRTGFPDRELWERIRTVEILGFDASGAAVERARQRSGAFSANTEYRVTGNLPSDLEPGIFTHALSLHPLLPNADRAELFSALRWLLCSGGQALVALPLRGSFQEVIDLLREYALKFDDTAFATELEAVVAARPSLETLSDEFEAAGFGDIDIEVRTLALPFQSGRAFMEDPVTRLLILPELRSWFEGLDLTRPLEYVREAMDKYWSETSVELSVNVGCASARCP